MSANKRGAEKEDLTGILLEICPAFLVACDSEGRIRQLNRAALKLTGYSRRELIGRPLLELLHPEEREKMQRLLRRLSAAPRRVNWRSRILTKNGEELHFAGNAKEVRVEPGRHRLFLLVGSDLTLRRSALQALQDSERTFHSVVENMHGSLAIIDARLRILYANPQMGRVFGRPSTELAGWEVEKALHLVFDDRSCERLLSRARRRLAGARVPASYTIRTVFRGREVRWFKLRVALLSSAGCGRRIVAQFIDITERLRALSALMKSERRCRSLVEAAPVGIITVERGGRILQANGKLARILGAPCTAAILELKAGMLDFAEELEECFRSGKTDVFERPCRSRWGRQAHLRIQLAALRVKKGRILQVQAVVEDISAQKAFAAVLAQSQKMEALSTLTGGIAHEFNNLLQVIQGYAEMLRLESRHEREDLNEICRATQRAAELTDQLLAFSGLQEGELKPLDLNEEIRATVRLLQRTLLKHVRVELRLAAALPPIAGDAPQLRQALTNIALNAGEVLDEQGWLRIETFNHRPDWTPDAAGPPRDGEHWVLLRISDNGPGIAPGDLNNVFDPFYTTKLTGKGVGLGLSVAYGIIRYHHGHIECRSLPGQGTSFDIFLPADCRQPAQQPLRQPGAEPFRLFGQGRQTVLLVDGEPTICRLASDFLAGAGYEMLSCSQPEEALELFRRNCGAIDLIILDALLPQPGGEKLLQELGRLRPGQKVLLAGGSPPGSLPNGLPAAGDCGFIKKPFKLTELLAAVREALEEEAEAASPAASPAG